MKNDSVYKGLGFMISGNGDTLFSERVSLEQHGNDLFYIPTVRDQNNQEAVTFKLISETGGEFVFENKAHDFPQRVIYKNPYPDTLYARIEGNDKGELRREEFKMARKK